MLMLPDYRVRQRDFLLEISRAITARLELKEVLRLVLRASTAMIAGEVGLIALRDEIDEQFHIRAITDIAADRVPQLNTKLRDLIATAGEGFDQEYLNTKLREMAVMIDRKLKQSIAMPLIFAGQPLGLLIVFRPHQFIVTSDDMQVLQSFADQAAIAVNNAQLYARMDHERMRLAAILQNSGDGFMILTGDLTVIHINRAFERMTGWSSQDATGLSLSEIILWKRIEQRDLPAILSEGWPFHSHRDAAEETFYVEGDLMRRDGLTLSIGITYAPLLDAENQLVSIIANVRDITNFRKAQEMQNVFISTISHELRTPIALIKGYANTLRREDAQWKPEVVRDNLGIIEEEADRLTDLVEDLLTASKIQAERQVTLNLGDVWLHSLAARAVERFNTAEKHKIILDFPPDFPVITGDEIRLRQVVDNLISNAIKYSPQGGEIIVGGSFNDAAVTLYVRDQGVGIALPEQAFIFDRFYRVDSALSRKTKGTGLGLYLAKAIIEAHSGTIGLESHPGMGSTFFFTLPR